MQKWNIPTDTAQRVDEKNGVNYLIIMFTPGVMVIKTLKNGSWLLMTFCWWQQNPVKVWAIYLKASERYHLDLLESAMDYWVLSNH